LRRPGRGRRPGRRVGFEENSVQRAFIRVEGEDGSRGVGLRGVDLEDQDGTVRVEAELLDPAGGEHGAAPVREAEVEPCPFAVPKRKAEVSRVGVEVEGLVVGDEERGPNIGDVGARPLPEATAVAGVEGEGSFRRGAGVGAIEAEFPGEALGEFGEGALGAEPLLESFPDAAVDYQSEVGEEGEDWCGERRREVADEASAHRDVT
jgi:hypothetical protein